MTKIRRFMNWILDIIFPQYVAGADWTDECVVVAVLQRKRDGTLLVKKIDRELKPFAK